MQELADFNNDGRDDLYVVSDVQDYIIFNESTNTDGTINFSTSNVANSGLTTNFGGNVHAFDVDRDGLMDMAVCDVDVDIAGCNRQFALLRNNGTTLVDPNNNLPSRAPWNVVGSHDMCWIDVNQDGFEDMFIASCFGYELFMNSETAVIGDANLDGVVDLLDIQPFVDVLISGGFLLQADTNQDGVVDLLDIAGLVDLLIGG